MLLLKTNQRCLLKGWWMALGKDGYHWISSCPGPGQDTRRACAKLLEAMRTFVCLWFNTVLRHSSCQHPVIHSVCVCVCDVKPFIGACLNTPLKQCPNFVKELQEKL